MDTMKEAWREREFLMAQRTAARENPEEKLAEAATFFHVSLNHLSIQAELWGLGKHAHVIFTYMNFLISVWLSEVSAHSCRRVVNGYLPWEAGVFPAEGKEGKTASHRCHHQWTSRWRCAVQQPGSTGAVTLL